MSCRTIGCLNLLQILDLLRQLTGGHSYCVTTEYCDLVECCITGVHSGYFEVVVFRVTFALQADLYTTLPVFVCVVSLFECL